MKSLMLILSMYFPFDHVPIKPELTMVEGNLSRHFDTYLKSKDEQRKVYIVSDVKTALDLDGKIIGFNYDRFRAYNKAEELDLEINDYFSKNGFKFMQGNEQEFNFQELDKKDFLLRELKNKQYLRKFEEKYSSILEKLSGMESKFSSEEEQNHLFRQIKRRDELLHKLAIECYLQVMGMEGDIILIAPSQLVSYIGKNIGMAHPNASVYLKE